MTPSDSHRASRRQSGLLVLPPLCSLSSRSTEAGVAASSEKSTLFRSRCLENDNESSRFGTDSLARKDSNKTGSNSNQSTKTRRNLPPTVPVKTKIGMNSISTEESTSYSNAPNQQHHFLHGLQLDDRRYNVLDIPSPPSPSSTKNRRRRFSLSAAGSFPLRDLTSDPNFENTSTSKTSTRSTLINNDEAITKRRSKNKRGRNSLCHVESPFHLANGAAKQGVDSVSKDTQSVTRDITSDQRNNFETTFDEVQVKTEGHFRSKRSRKSISVVPSETIMHEPDAQCSLPSIDQTERNCIIDSSDFNSITSPRKVSLDMCISRIEPQEAEEREKSSRQKKSSFFLEKQVLQLNESSGKTRSKRRRQSSIGVLTAHDSASRLRKNNQRRSLSPSVEDKSLASVRYSSIQMTNNQGTLPNRDPLVTAVEKTTYSPRRFPELPKPDAKLIAPVLSEARKLIHTYTSNLSRLDGGFSPELQSHTLKRIEQISGYVITPPVADDFQTKKIEDSHYNINKMDLWLRMGPDLKRMEKFKSETAAAVEEVTETRIEKHKGKYKYFHLDKSKGERPMKPAEYEARYAVMQEEVFNIRSQCWDEYFEELEAYSVSPLNANRECGDPLQITSLNTNFSENSRLVGPAAKNQKISHPRNVEERGTVEIQLNTEKQVDGGVYEVDDISAMSQIDPSGIITDNSVIATGLSSEGPHLMELDKDPNQRVLVSDDVPEPSLHSNQEPATDLDAFVIRSPLSMDADAYRAACGRQIANSEKVVIDYVPEPKGRDSSDTASGEDSEQIDDLFRPMPSRDEPSADPEIAKVEQRLWREIDYALDRYSREVVTIRRRRALENARKLILRCK